MSLSGKITVYPYDSAFTPIVRHKTLLGELEIAHLVSPFSFGYCGKDAGAADRGPDTGLIVEEDFSECIKDSDYVLFVPTEVKYDYEQMIVPKLEEAINAGKNIIMSIKLAKERCDEISRKCEEKNTLFYYLRLKDWESIKLDPPELSSHRLNRIDTPVVFVMGDGERTGKFETQLALREFFLKEGYKVSQIGSRDYCELLGFRSAPGFLFEPRLEMEKIFLFNEYVKNIELYEKPDVIIIGIPGSIMALNKSNSTYCGITAFEISNAISPDATVFCMYDISWDIKYYEELKQVMKHKFGFEPDAFVMSNTRIDWMGMAEKRNRMYIFTLAEEKVNAHRNMLQMHGIEAVNILDATDARKMCETVEDKLASYADVDSF